MKRLPATAVVFLLALGLYAATTHRRVFIAGNDASRWAAIESIVDYGSASVERSRFAANIDRVRIDGRDYSNKPPLLSLAGAAVYAGLQALTGWRLAGPGAASVLFWVTLVLVGVPSAWLAAQFFAALGRFPDLGRTWQWLLTVALAAGTLLFTFSTTLNNHTVAAALLFAACIAALDGRGLASGFGVGLAAAVDFLPGLGLAPVFAWILRRGASAHELRRYAAGLAICAAIAGGANLATYGSLLPTKLVPGAVDLSALAGPSAGGVVLPQNPAYPLEILFGGHGLFAVSPVLLWGAWGLALACRRSSAALPFGPPGDLSIWRILALGLVLQFAGHAALAGSYGGWSYGYRYLVPIQPLLLLCAPLARRGALALAGGLCGRAADLRPLRRARRLPSLAASLRAGVFGASGGAPGGQSRRWQCRCLVGGERFANCPRRMDGEPLRRSGQRPAAALFRAFLRQQRGPRHDEKVRRLTRRDSPQEAPPSAAAKRTSERKSTRTLPATLLFFGDRFAAIDKPAGLSLRTSRADPHGAARGLVEALRFRDRELFAGREPQLVHRLDESTSGVVLVALDVDIHRELVGRFAARQAEKRYLALVWGHPKPAAGVWEERLGPDRKDRRRMKVDPEGRPALTEYRTLARAAL
jgi:hypothetical protein